MRKSLFLLLATLPAPAFACMDGERVEIPSYAQTMRIEAREAEKNGRTRDAIRWHEELANSGEGAAAKRLAEIYRNGAPGIQPNPAKAQEWARRAKELGDSQARAYGTRQTPQAAAQAARSAPRADGAVAKCR